MGGKMNNLSEIKLKGVGNQAGSYDTPLPTVEFMIKKALKYIPNPRSILDPCVGNGIFIKALLNMQFSAKIMTAHDIDGDCLKDLEISGINCYVKDSLIDDFGKFDLIIGNPPYKSRRQSMYMKEHKVILEKKYNTIGLYNLYALFIYNSILHLNPGGIICFIVEDSFCMNRYYRKLRDFILNSVKILEIILAPSDLFHDMDADVRTAIIIMQKAEGPLYHQERNENDMILIDRLNTQEEFANPPKKKILKQKIFGKTPDHKFIIGIPDSILDLILKTKKTFNDVSFGGTGISTGNDALFLKKSSEINDPNWVPFYKSGKRTPYYYISEDKINRNYEDNEKKYKDYIVRNKIYYFKEGITCSSIGRHFSASYMPEGCLFGVNANFFFNSTKELYFYLGLLNSKLFEYIGRKFLNRSNILATSFIREFPIVDFSNQDIEQISNIVKNIVLELMKNPNYSFDKEQDLIDQKFYSIYGIDEEIQKEIVDFHENIFDRI